MRQLDCSKEQLLHVDWTEWWPQGTLLSRLQRLLLSQAVSLDLEVQGLHGWDILRACNAVKKAAQDKGFEAGVKAAAAIHKRASRVSSALAWQTTVPSFMFASLQAGWECWTMTLQLGRMHQHADPSCHTVSDATERQNFHPFWSIQSCIVVRGPACPAHVFKTHLQQAMFLHVGEMFCLYGFIKLNTCLMAFRRSSGQ